MSHTTEGPTPPQDAPPDEPKTAAGWTTEEAHAALQLVNFDDPPGERESADDWAHEGDAIERDYPPDPDAVAEDPDRRAKSDVLDALALMEALASVGREFGISVGDIAHMLESPELIKANAGAAGATEPLEAAPDTDTAAGAPVPRDPSRMIQAPIALGWMLGIGGDPIAVAIVSNRGLTEPYDTKLTADAWLRDVATGMTWLVVTDAEAHVMGRPHDDGLHLVTSPQAPNPNSQQIRPAEGETIGLKKRRWPFGR